MTEPAPVSRMLRQRAVLAYSGLGRSMLYLRINAGTWPRPVKIGPNLNAWPEHEVQAMNAAAAAGYDDAALRALVETLERQRLRGPSVPCHP